LTQKKEFIYIVDALIYLTDLYDCGFSKEDFKKEFLDKGFLESMTPD